MWWRIRRWLANYGASVPFIFLGLILLTFLVNVDALQIPAVQQGGPQAEKFWNTLSNILVVIASSFLSIGGMIVGNAVQSQHRQRQEIREFRRQIAKEYREYLTWLLKIGQHADFVLSNPELRKALPAEGHGFSISSEVRAEIIRRMPLIWDFSSLYDDETEDVSKAIDDAILNALRYLSLIGQNGNLEDTQCEKVRLAYKIAMKKLNEYENRF
ncbi:MAG: hypothetical protein DDG60_08685 [Anaerolineae bacterium]|nr:MAG: hypothetical protein DDG60_08685 [Anaerolineae bacterium]